MPGEIIQLKTFPRYRVVARELFACRASELSLWQALGPPTSEVNPPLGKGTPQMFWDVEFPCGMVMGLHFDCISERLVAHLDLPEVAHALRHLGLRPTEVWLLEEAEPDVFAQLAPQVSHSFSLWEQESGGEPELLAANVTDRDAHCQLEELDGLEPGVRMWVASADDPHPLPPRLDLQKPKIGRVTAQDVEDEDDDDDRDQLPQRDHLDPITPAPVLSFRDVARPRASKLRFEADIDLLQAGPGPAAPQAIDPEPPAHADDGDLLDELTDL